MPDRLRFDAAKKALLLCVSRAEVAPRSRTGQWRAACTPLIRVAHESAIMSLSGQAFLANGIRET
jgi:hypothetical protein